MYNTYAHIVEGQIKALNIRRGGLFKGRRLGKLSPESTYRALNLYPIIGTRPLPGQDEKVEGPTYKWNPDFETVEKLYTLVKIDLEQIAIDKAREEAFSALDHLDKKSIRGLREFLVAKYGDDPMMPERLLEVETLAKEERSKL